MRHWRQSSRHCAVSPPKMVVTIGEAVRCSGGARQFPRKRATATPLGFLAPSWPAFGLVFNTFVA